MSILTPYMLVPLMSCWPSSFLLISEQSRPILLAKDRSHFPAYCGWRRSCAHVMYSPVFLLRNKHAVACCARIYAAIAVLCGLVRGAIGFVSACDGLAFLDLILCAIGSCTCCRSWRSPLVMVSFWAPLVIVPGWAPLEVTVGACCSWCGLIFDCWLLWGVPCVFRFNYSMVDCRGGISFCCGVTRYLLKMLLISWMAASCDDVLLLLTSCIAHVIRCTACTMRSSGVSIGCWRYVWKKSTVSDILTCFVWLAIQWGIGNTVMQGQCRNPLALFGTIILLCWLCCV